MNSKIIGSLCGISLLALGVSAQAAEPPAKAEQPAAVASPAVVADQAKPAPVKMSADELDKLSGGKEVVVSLTNQDLTAVNSGNTVMANTVGSGNISLSGGALSDFNGIGNFVMNTGHNNNLQSSMSVTIIMTPN